MRIERQAVIKMKIKQPLRRTNNALKPVVVVLTKDPISELTARVAASTSYLKFPSYSLLDETCLRPTTFETREGKAGPESLRVYSNEMILYPPRNKSILNILRAKKGERVPTLSSGDNMEKLKDTVFVDAGRNCDGFKRVLHMRDVNLSMPYDIFVPKLKAILISPGEFDRKNDYLIIKPELIMGMDFPIKESYGGFCKLNMRTRLPVTEIEFHFSKELGEEDRYLARYFEISDTGGIKTIKRELIYGNRLNVVDCNGQGNERSLRAGFVLGSRKLDKDFIESMELRHLSEVVICIAEENELEDLVERKLITQEQYARFKNAVTQCRLLGREKGIEEDSADEPEEPAVEIKGPVPERVEREELDHSKGVPEERTVEYTGVPSDADLTTDFAREGEQIEMDFSISGQEKPEPVDIATEDLIPDEEGEEFKPQVPFAPAADGKDPKILVIGDPVKGYTLDELVDAINDTRYGDVKTLGPLITEEKPSSKITFPNGYTVQTYEDAVMEQGRIPEVKTVSGEVLTALDPKEKQAQGLKIMENARAERERPPVQEKPIMLTELKKPARKITPDTTLHDGQWTTISGEEVNGEDALNKILKIKWQPLPLVDENITGEKLEPIDIPEHEIKEATPEQTIYDGATLSRLKEEHERKLKNKPKK